MEDIANKEKKIREHLQNAGFENNVIDKIVDVLDIEDAYENLMRNVYKKGICTSQNCKEK